MDLFSLAFHNAYEIILLRHYFWSETEAFRNIIFDGTCIMNLKCTRTESSCLIKQELSKK